MSNPHARVPAQESAARQLDLQVQEDSCRRNGRAVFIVQKVDPECVHAAITAVLNNPESFDAWCLLRNMLTEVQQTLLTCDSATELIRRGSGVFSSTTNVPLFQVILKVFASFCLPEIDDSFTILVESNVLQSLPAEKFLSPKIPELLIPVNDVVFAAISDYNKSPEQEWAVGMFTEYLVQIMCLLQIGLPEYVVVPLMGTCRVMIRKMQITKEDAESLLRVFYGFVKEGLSDVIDSALHCIWTLFRIYPELYENVVQNVVGSVVYHLNVDSLMAVKYAAKIFRPILAKGVLPEEMLGMVVRQIQQSIACAKHNAVVDYLAVNLVVVCETSEVGCRMVLELGILESELMTAFSSRTTTCMVGIYRAALKFGLLELRGEYEEQIVRNVTDALESDDCETIVMVLDAIAALTSRSCAFPEAMDRIDELRMHENPAIMEKASTLFDMISNV